MTTDAASGLVGLDDSVSDVVAALGEPDKKYTSNGQPAWEWQCSNGEIVVTFQDGRAWLIVWGAIGEEKRYKAKSPF